MDPKEGGIEALQNKFFWSLLEYIFSETAQPQKKLPNTANVYKYWWKLQPKQILSGNFVYKVELENSRIWLLCVNNCIDVGPKQNIKKRKCDI